MISNAILSICFVHAAPRKGSLVEAYRQAGYGQGSTPSTQAKGAWQLSRDERVLAAITEESKKILRVAFPEAANAMVNLIRIPAHREHGRAIGLLMERAFPVETKHNIEVVHKTVDPDVEAVEELRALSQARHGARQADRIVRRQWARSHRGP